MLLDVQYIIFVRHITGQSIQSSAIRLFIIIFILSCSSLVLVPGLIFLIIKNESVANKLMNAALASSFVSSFVFCFYVNSYWGGDSSARTGAVTTLLIALVMIAVYAVLKSQMHALYFNLISVLFIENDHRISPVSIKAIDAINNFVVYSHPDRHP